MLIQQGAEIDLGHWSLGPPDVDAYLQAIEDHSTIYTSLSVVPPLAMVAHVVKEILERLSLPPGTLHATQEMSCLRGVMVGEKMSTTASFGRPLLRGEWQFISANFTVWGHDGEMALKGRTTVIVPVKEGTGE